MSLAERFADEISLEYSLIDRMRVRGHVLNLQTITMLRMFFQQVRGVEWIEPQHLQQLTSEFVQFVEDYAKLHDVPLISAKPGESHVDQAAQYLDRVADRDKAVYCIIKVQEETSSFVSYVPKGGTGKERKIANSTTNRVSACGRKPRLMTYVSSASRRGSITFPTCFTAWPTATSDYCAGKTRSTRPPFLRDSSKS